MYVPRKAVNLKRVWSGAGADKREQTFSSITVPRQPSKVSLSFAFFVISSLTSSLFSPGKGLADVEVTKRAA